MKYKQLAAAAAICLVGIGVLHAAANEFGKTEGGFDFKKWGQILSQDAQKETEAQGINTASAHSDAIYAQGRDAAVTVEDVEMGTQFYMASGLNESEAKEKTVAYFKEYEALYAEAVRRGCSADDREVSDYVDEMKENIFGETTDEETQKQYREMISQFDSEDAYWEYEKKVYKKQLPIEKLVELLEDEYLQQNEDDGSGFDAWYEDYKDDLVEAENYH